MTIRWGIIGCGDVARRRVANAVITNPNSELVAVCRRDEAKLRQFCDEFEITRSYTDADQLICDPELDAVYVATPVNLHLPQTIAAARAGKHVLVEKPMAMTVGECDEMIDVCRRQNVKLGVAYYRRYYPVVEHIKQLIESGEIGDVLSVSVATAAAFAMTPEDDGYWRVIPEQGGGGALMDIGSHRINLLLYLFGNIADVRCFAGTVAADYESEDSASLVMQFHNGIHGSLQCFFGCPVDPDEFTVIGTKGRLRSAPLNGGSLTIELSAQTRNELHPPNENFNVPLIADFVEAIENDREPLVSGEDGRDVNVVMARAYDECASRRRSESPSLRS